MKLRLGKDIASFVSEFTH